MRMSWHANAELPAGHIRDRDARTRDGVDDETALSSRARDGDADAFEVALRRYVQRVYRYLYYRVRRDEEAEDLTSEVFLRALRAMPRYRPSAPFLAWLYRIAHNAVVDRARKARDDFEFDEEIPNADVGADEGDPATRTLDRERRTRIRGAISRLPHDQQDAIVLRFVDGLSSDEIARLIGRSPSTVRGLQRRAFANLRRMLPPEGV